MPNFGCVTATLFYGGQPTADFHELKKRGIEMVVNLRDEHCEIETERREMGVLGLRYVRIP